MGFLGFGDSADAGMDYLNKMPGMLNDINGPYIERGNQQYAGLNQTYGQMGQDPTTFLNNIMQKYRPSESYNLQRDEAMRAAGNTAAAGGMRGSMADITNQSRLADSLMGQDMQQWLSNVMGIQNQGLQGQQNFYNQGYSAATGMASDLSNLYGSQASMAMRGQEGQNAGLQNLLGMLASGAGMAAGAYFGGPMGAAAGAQLGGQLGRSM